MMKKTKITKISVALALSILLMISLVTSHSAMADMLFEAGSDEFYDGRELIARVVECTAPDASYAARLAIACVIVNRVRDVRFPSDLYSVVYQRGEFACVSTDRFASVEPSYLSRVAARDALLGFDISSGAVYFRQGYPSERHGCCFYHDGFLFYK